MNKKIITLTILSIFLLAGLTTVSSTQSEIEEADKKKRSGSLHVYDPAGDSLTWLRHFDGLKPEGITCNSETAEFLITFDRGRNNPSKIMKLPFSRLKETE